MSNGQEKRTSHTGSNLIKKLVKLLLIKTYVQTHKLSVILYGFIHFFVLSRLLLANHGSPLRAQLQRQWKSR